MSLDDAFEAIPSRKEAPKVKSNISGTPNTKQDRGGTKRGTSRGVTGTSERSQTTVRAMATSASSLLEDAASVVFSAVSLHKRSRGPATCILRGPGHRPLKRIANVEPEMQSYWLSWHRPCCQMIDLLGVSSTSGHRQRR